MWLLNFGDAASASGIDDYNHVDEVEAATAAVARESLVTQQHLILLLLSVHCDALVVLHARFVVGVKDDLLAISSIVAFSGMS